MEPGESIKESFGRRLRGQRERAGYTADKLAAALKVHRNTVYHLERGEQWISSDLLEKIASELRVSPAVFFTDDVVKIEPTPEEALAVLAKAIRQKPNFDTTIAEVDDEIERLEDELGDDNHSQKPKKLR